MPEPREVYEALIAEITVEEERKVFDYLLQAGKERVTRDELIHAVYGETMEDGQPEGEEDGLAYSTKDRKVREIVRRLRERDYPIISSSDSAGYTLQGSEEEMEVYIAQQSSRVEKLQDNISHAYRSERIMHLVREYREKADMPVQLSFIESGSRVNS